MRWSAEMLTPSGGALLAAGAGLLVATALTGYPQLAALCAVCMATVVMAALSTPRLPLEVTASWESARIVDGASATLRVTARNQGRRRSRITLVTVVGSAEESPSLAEATVPELAAGQSRVVISEPTDLPRGVHQIEQLMTVSTDVLGLFQREHRTPSDLTLIVQPRTATRGRIARRPTDDGGRVSARNRPGGEAFHTLRAYQPGDETKHIHWMATARTGTVMIREFGVPESTGQTVILDTSPEVYGLAPPDAHADSNPFEIAVRVAASVAVAAVRQADLQLLTSAGLERNFRSGTHRDEVLDPFSAVATGPASPGSVRTAVRSRSTELTVVTGPVTDLRYWRGVAGTRPLTIVLISDEPPPPTRSTGSVRLLSVSSLHDFSTHWTTPWRG